MSAAIVFGREEFDTTSPVSREPFPMKYEAVTLPVATEWIGQAWSAALQEKLKAAIQRAYYQKGFPDVVVRIVAEPGPGQDGRRRR